jgi:hypothetical protein
VTTQRDEYREDHEDDAELHDLDAHVEHEQRTQQPARERLVDAEGARESHAVDEAEQEHDADAHPVHAAETQPSAAQHDRIVGTATPPRAPEVPDGDEGDRERDHGLPDDRRDAHDAERREDERHRVGERERRRGEHDVA